MFEKSSGCPDGKSIESYFLGLLDSEKNREIEEHFFRCNLCIAEARRISNEVTKLKILKANNVLGLAWEKYGDKIEEFKSAEDREKSIREFETRNKKFKITLRPIEDSTDLCLLEIKVLDNSLGGHILIDIDGQRNKAEIDKNGLVCLMVKRDIDLTKIIIRTIQL